MSNLSSLGMCLMFFYSDLKVTNLSNFSLLCDCCIIIPTDELTFCYCGILLTCCPLPIIRAFRAAMRFLYFSLPQPLAAWCSSCGSVVSAPLFSSILSLCIHVSHSLLVSTTQLFLWWHLYSYELDGHVLLYFEAQS